MTLVLLLILFSFFLHFLPLLRQDRLELTGSEVWGGSGKVLVSGLAQYQCCFYIYMYEFSRHFYPKRLTVYSYGMPILVRASEREDPDAE